MWRLDGMGRSEAQSMLLEVMSLEEEEEIGAGRGLGDRRGALHELWK